MQYSVHLPSAFINQHWQQLLPEWSLPVASVLVMLQRCPIELHNRTTETEIYKDQLRRQFLTAGGTVVWTLQQARHLAAVFDPRTGCPVSSVAGELRLDDVAVVRSLLGYAIVRGDCSVICHPQWGGAVYPSVLLSSASPPVVEQVAHSILRHRFAAAQLTALVPCCLPEQTAFIFSSV